MIFSPGPADPPSIVDGSIFVLSPPATEDALVPPDPSARPWRHPLATVRDLIAKVISGRP